MSNEARVSLAKALFCPWKLRQYFRSRNQEETPVVLQPREPIVLEPEMAAHAACEVDTTPMPSGNKDDLVIKEPSKTKEAKQERTVYVTRHPNAVEAILLFSSGLLVGAGGTMLATRPDLQEQPGYRYQLPKQPGPHFFDDDLDRFFQDPRLFRREQIQNQGFEPNALKEELLKNRKDDYKALKGINDLSKRVPAVAKYAKPAVVFINSELRENIPYGSGTGFIYSSDDNGSTIVTNRHVVELPFGRVSSEVKIILINGKQVVGNVIGTDLQYDLALVKINEKNLPTLELSTSEPQDAEFVMAIGNPQKLGWTTTFGIISGIDRTLPGANTKVIQTDAPLNPGNSGGPLLNMDGNVIAVNQAIITGLGQYQNLGFGIPVRDVRNVIPRILTQKKPNSERSNGLKLPPNFFKPFNKGPFNEVPNLDNF